MPLAPSQGSTYRLQAVLKRTELFIVSWHPAQPPVGFEVQPGGACLLEQALEEMDGTRRLVEAGAIESATCMHILRGSTPPQACSSQV